MHSKKPVERRRKYLDESHDEFLRVALVLAGEAERGEVGVLVLDLLLEVVGRPQVEPLLVRVGLVALWQLVHAGGVVLFLQLQQTLQRRHLLAHPAAAPRRRFSAHHIVHDFVLFFTPLDGVRGLGT